ncbi:MAG: sodium/proton antiporter NhaB [Gammaproteobacteria bacterium]|nr:sodium/proton antiporter NhaB [Gammaproteobacteria bacterium]
MAVNTMTRAFTANFLGNSPDWYKLTIIGFLLVNPILLVILGPFITGWIIIAEFIFTLAMALNCYPLQPGGLLAIESVLMGLTSAEMVYEETLHNFPVILLLMFMVAGIYFLKDLLLFIFTKILLDVRSKVVLSLLFSLAGAVLSAFLDALTVTAVIITVASGFYGVYHKVASGKKLDLDHDPSTDTEVADLHREDLEQFRGFLRSLMMHGAVGTALGGVTTLVGEPQNLLIGKVMGWEFITFFVKVAPVSMPVLVVGLATCALLEITGTFGFGVKLSDNVRNVLDAYEEEQEAKRGHRDRAILIVQGIAAMILVFGLAFHLAEVGLIGLTVIVLATAFNGVTEEHRLGHAFAEALPFTSLLVVFFGIVAMIHDQHLFKPVIDYVLTMEGTHQLAAFYGANGLLSAISDNVFVATVYITEVKSAFEAGVISREQFDLLAVAINTGTNIPSVATPNGQAAFLFLLTSALAPLIRLSYMRMVIMAFPYMVTMSTTGLLAVYFLL